MNHKNRLSGVLLPTLLMLLPLGACDNRQQKAQDAYAQYQAAQVSGDLRAARMALIALVSADDSNPQYWAELGKISMQMSDFGAAYDAFQHAHELNRADAEVLTMMTQLALRSGDLDVAADNANQLDLVSPGNVAVALTRGYVALRRSDLDEADRQATALLAAAPYNGSGKVLQARILMARNQPEQAISLLRKQISEQPSDAESLRALASIFELREQWGDTASTLRTYMSYAPNDATTRVRLVEAELRSGQVEQAADITLGAIDKEDVDSLLEPWIAVGKQEAIADRLFEWAKSANYGRRLAAARFLATTAEPARILALTEGDATLPVRPSNTVANALFATGLGQSGRVPEALARLDAILKLDGTNREALSGRALFRSKAGDKKGAIEDAQKLVAVDGESASGRLLLARIYTAAGDPDGARRTLWDAFHDLGSDHAIYDALLPLVAKSDDPQAAARLSKEFYDKRSHKLTRSFA